MKKVIIAVLAMLMLAGNSVGSSYTPEEIAGMQFIFLFMALEAGGFGDSRTAGANLFDAQMAGDDGSRFMNMNRQEFDKHYRHSMLGLTIQALAENYRDIRQDFQAAQRIRNFDSRITAFDKIRQDLESRCRNQNTPQCIEARERFTEYRAAMGEAATMWGYYRAAVARIKRDEKEKAEREAAAQAERARAAEARSEREAAERARREREQQRQDSIRVEQARLDSVRAEQERIAREESRRLNIFGGDITHFANNHFRQIMQNKSEFITTESFYNDSTEIVFRRFILNELLPLIVFSGLDSIDIGRYNADAQVFNVRPTVIGFRVPIGYDINHFIRTHSASHNLARFATLRVSPSEAQSLVQGGYTYEFSRERYVFTRNNHSNSFIFPTQVTIISKADPTKRYVVNFERPSEYDGWGNKVTGNNIIFSGRYLWRDNPRAANLEYSISELLAPIEKELAWAERVSASNVRRLVLRLDEGEFVFQVGQRLPRIKMGKNYTAKGQIVRFARDQSAIFINGVRIARISMYGSRIRRFDIEWDYRFLGYGIFDVE